MSILIPEPDGLTLGEMMIRLGKDVGAWRASSITALAETPDGAPEQVQMLKAAINDAYREFIEHDPNWSFIVRDLKITTSSVADERHVDGDPGRMLLPHPVTGLPVTDWIYSTDESGIRRLVKGDSERIESLLAFDDSSGIPVEYTHRAYDDHRWVMLMFPRPSGAYPLRCTVRIEPHDLIDVDERHIAGKKHDSTILAIARANWELRDTERPQSIEQWERKKQQRLIAAVRLDSPNRHTKIRHPNTSAQGLVEDHRSKWSTPRQYENEPLD